jgi:hypothetical protein
MNNVNEGWRRVRALMPLTGLALCASAFAADPTPAAAGAVATPDAAVAAAPESAPDATADNGAAPVRFLVMANQEMLVAEQTQVIYLKPLMFTIGMELHLKVIC